MHLFIVFLTFYCQNFSETGPKIDQGLCFVQARSILVEIRKFSVWWLVWSTRQNQHWIRAYSCLNQVRLWSNLAVFCSFLTGSKPPLCHVWLVFLSSRDLRCDSAKEVRLISSIKVISDWYQIVNLSESNSWYVSSVPILASISWIWLSIRAPQLK